MKNFIYCTNKCITNFTKEFANTAENIFKNTERKTDLDKWYVRLMSTIFETIQNIAAEHPKTPPEVIKMGNFLIFHHKINYFTTTIYLLKNRIFFFFLENFHHLYALLSQLKISVLDGHRKEVKQKYNEALNAYVTRYFGRPLEKLNVNYVFLVPKDNLINSMSFFLFSFLFLVVF